MNFRINKSPTASYPIFSAVDNKLGIININNFNERICGDILAGRVEKKLSIKRTGIIGIVSFIFALLAFSPVNAQTSYDEDDYDNYYDDYSDNAYSTENPYDKYNYNHKYKDEERYRKASREEDLYNGRYQGRGEGSSWSQAGVSVSGWSKKTEGDNKRRDAQNNNPSRGDRDMSPDENPVNDIPTNINDADEGTSHGGDERNNEGPPPPPDEPDVPVDTAIPLLIVAGIGLAGFKFYIQKRASVI